MTTNQHTADALQQVLADTYALYTKTQNYHWNVVGANFKSLHELFELQYTELATAVDEIAERIRALGDVIPGGFQKDASDALILADENKNDREMVQDLYEGHQAVIKTLKKAQEAASLDKDAVTDGLVVDRLTVHEKAAWMLKATLGH